MNCERWSVCHLLSIGNNFLITKKKDNVFCNRQFQPLIVTQKFQIKKLIHKWYINTRTCIYIEIHMHIYRNVLVRDLELCYFSDFNKVQNPGSNHYSYLIMHVSVYTQQKFWIQQKFIWWIKSKNSNIKKKKKTNLNTKQIQIIQLRYLAK